MTNRTIANILFNIATILDLASDNIYRVRAYRRAARRMLRLPEEAARIVARGEPLPLPGVGERIQRKLAELIATDTMMFYQELLADLPEYMRGLMVIDGVGPKIAERLHAELGLSSPEGVYAAAQRGAIRDLWGFGPRQEARLAEAAEAAVGILARVA